MISLTGIKIHNLAMLVMLAVVVSAAIISSFTEYIIYRTEFRKYIDDELRIAATFARELLPADYHDRIENRTSVSTDEFDRIVNRYNKLCIELELEYIWSLMIYEDQIVFTSSTSPDKNVHNHTHAKFFEVHSNPEFYDPAFQTMEPQFQDITDKWGALRAVLIPHYDSHGRKYLFGASKKLKNIEAISSYVLRNTLLTTAVFLIPGLIISLLASKWLTRPISKLAEAAKQISKGAYDPTIDISGAYEINVLSEQLNNMSISIKEHVKTIEQPLKELREFEAIVNNSPVIFFRVRLEPDFPTEFISDNIDVMGFSAKDMLEGKVTWDHFLSPDSLKKISSKIEATLSAGKETYNLEAPMTWLNGEEHCYSNFNRIICNAQGHPTHVQGLLVDITDQKQFADSLKLANQNLSEFHQIVTSSPILIYRTLLDENYTVEFLSDNYSTLGYDIEQLRSGELRFDDLSPVEDLERAKMISKKALANGEETNSSEIRIRWADGSIHWYQCWNQFLRDESGEYTKLQGILTEITDLIDAKERDRHYQARLRALSQDLLRVEDKERRRLAISLHDDIGQMLAALNMKFSVLKETSDRKVIDDLVPQVDELLIRIMSTCKTLTWEISPTSLYETDIAAGLERMADELKNFFGLRIKLETMGTRIVLDRDSAAFIFRCAKELMINIAKHAGVNDAEVGISQYGDKVHMVVSDSGVGFNTDSLTEKSGLGFGLFSIRERVEHMNGSLHIESAPGEGTKVMLILPLDISALI